MATVIVINNNQMGMGDAELGRKAMTNCLRKLITWGDLEAIVLYNLGVTLAAKDSYVAAELKQLHETHGVEILACTTCVEHYGLVGKLVVDKPSSMDEILATLKKAEKVVTL